MLARFGVAGTNVGRGRFEGSKGFWGELPVIETGFSEPRFMRGDCGGGNGGLDGDRGKRRIVSISGRLDHQVAGTTAFLALMRWPSTITSTTRCSLGFASFAGSWTT